MVLNCFFAVDSWREDGNRGTMLWKVIDAFASIITKSFLIFLTSHCGGARGRYSLAAMLVESRR